MPEEYEKVLGDFLEEFKNYSAFNFIMEYADLLSQVTDAPIEYHLAAALFLLSTVTGKTFRFLSAVDSKLFTLNDDDIDGRKLILWFIILGKSRISRKTTGVINKIKEITKELYINTVSRSFTIPALISELSKMVEDKSVNAAWICDECSSFFILMSKKDGYIMDAEAVLSCLYDGKSYSATTQSRGKESVPNPVLTCLLASTNNLPSKFKSDAFWQGFYNRFIFVPATRKTRKQLRPRLSADEKKKAKEIIHYLTAVKTLNYLYYLVLDKEANAIYSQYEESIENRIEKEDLGIKEGYMGGIPNFVIRIACLFRINRMSKEELMELDEEHPACLPVTEKDMKMAIKFGKLIWFWFEKMMSLRTKHSSEPEKVKTTEDYEAIILSIYKERGVRELPQNFLRTLSKIQSDKLEKILEGIAYRRAGKSTGGRRPLMWVLRDEIKL